MDAKQHGGRAGRSTLSQLILHHDQILQAMEEGSNIDAVYLDFAKAFDKVDHGLLLHKLKQMGVKGKLGRWIQNFLKGRPEIPQIPAQIWNSTRECAWPNPLPDIHIRHW